MAEVDATSRRLLAVLADAPAGLSKRKAAELAGVNPETARQRIAKLEAAGLVTVNGVVKTANGAHATP
jgi:DNA-binding Lrp family transcriptional regulator